MELIISCVIDATNQNADSIKTTLETETASVGATLSQAMLDIWSKDGEFTSVVTTYSNSFSSAFTTTNETLEKIRKYLAKMAGESDEKAEEKIENPTGTPKPETPKQETPNQPTSPNTGDGVPKVGDKVTFTSGQYYYSSDGLTPTGNQLLGQSVYITKINSASWAKKPYHIARDVSGAHPLGWVALDQLKGYESGGLVDETGPAMLHGKKKKPEMVLNARDTENFIELKDTLQEIDFNKLLESAGAFNNLSNLANNISDIPCSNVKQNVTIQVGDIQMYGVNDPETFAAQLKDALKNNKSITKIIQADTLGVMTGKNSLSKFRY